MSKRVFSNMNNLNFCDYNNLKKGIEIMKNKKSQDLTLDYFFSYSDFLTLTKVFFKFNNNNDISNNNYEKVPFSIIEGTESFVIYNKINLHVNNCEVCKNSNNNFEYLMNCKEIRNILYPLGKYITNEKNDTIYFPNKLNINKFCIKQKNDFCINQKNDLPKITHNEDKSKSKKNIFSESESLKKITSDEKKCNCCISQNKKARPLFI
jgi:hypothetical protein